MRGKACQNKQMIHRNMASICGFPCDRTIYANKPMPKAPPSPKVVNATETRMRDSNSNWPCVVRRALTKRRQRSHAMAVSWLLRGTVRLT